jgi:hypothetical protein
MSIQNFIKTMPSPESYIEKWVLRTRRERSSRKGVGNFNSKVRKSYADLYIEFKG